MPTKKTSDKAPQAPGSEAEAVESESNPFALGPQPGASSAPGGNTDNVYLCVGTEPRKVDTSLVTVPEGVKVGAFLGVDPNAPTAPASITRVPLAPTE